MEKINYFLRSALRLGTTKVCPYCQRTESRVVDRKYGVTTLNECSRCHLLYRHPADSVAFNRDFYQSEYTEPDGITTDLPDDETLRQMQAINFAVSGKDYSDKIALIKALTPGRRLVDYGASWGYTSYQFAKQGFSVQAYEISRPRAAYGKKLGIDILVDETALQPGVDVFFNAHVIEHVPDIRHLFRLAQRLLTDEGLFVAYCPNGSAALRTTNPQLFHRLWGQVHPNLLSAEFFSAAFADVPYVIGSEAATDAATWDGQSQRVLDVSGHELFAIAKIKKQRF